jgi:hypothetical protein
MKVQDINFSPRFLPETLEKAKAWLVDNQRIFSDTANYCIFSDTEQTAHFGRVCHRDISSPTIRNRAMVASEFGWRRNAGMTRELARPFIDYIVNQSYMGRFLLIRDVDFILDNGFIVSADVAAPLLQNIMIVSRHGYEIPARAFSKFNELIQEGILPDLAYLCVFGTGYSNKTGTSIVDISSYPVAAIWGHRAHPLLPISGVRNFIHGEIGQMLGLDCNSPLSHYRANKDYRGGVKMFLPAFKQAVYDPNLDPSKDFTRGLFKIDSFKEELSARRKERSQEKTFVVPNPFARRALGAPPPMMGDQVTYEELFSFVLPYVQLSGLLDEACTYEPLLDGVKSSVTKEATISPVPQNFQGGDPLPDFFLNPVIAAYGTGAGQQAAA